MTATLAPWAVREAGRSKAMFCPARFAGEVGEGWPPVMAVHSLSRITFTPGTLR